MVSKHKGTGATTFSPRRSVRFFEFSKYSLMQKSKYLVLEHTKK